MNNKTRKESAEAQNTKAPSEEDFVGLIKYVEERERNLSKYSNKLRQNLQRIFSIFSPPYCCRICGCSENDQKHIPFRDEQGYLHDEKTSTVNGITVTYGANKNYSHDFVETVSISIDVQDDVFEERSTDKEGDEQFWLQIVDGDFAIASGWDHNARWLTNPSGRQSWTPDRELLKALVRSGRLPKFLALIAQKLSEAEKEYGDVAEIAEKMAKAIEHSPAENTNRRLSQETDAEGNT
jgi:mRNA degradation ribonuclease J1/J2